MTDVAAHHVENDGILWQKFVVKCRQFGDKGIIGMRDEVGTRIKVIVSLSVGLGPVQGGEPSDGLPAEGCAAAAGRGEGRCEYWAGVADQQ